jgi:hypothetical protein
MRRVRARKSREVAAESKHPWHNGTHPAVATAAIAAVATAAAPTAAGIAVGVAAAVAAVAEAAAEVSTFFFVAAAALAATCHADQMRGAMVR